VDTISLSMIDSVEQLLRTGLQAQLNAERNFELDAVERLQVAAGKENKAVVGTADTLKALGEGRILSLFYADNFTASGKECTSCHALFTEDAPARCAYCNKPLKPLEGLLDAMLLKALATGSRVEQVRGKGAEKLRESGGIGAFLRY
jgi:peptide subunit release factor 1 (eRF1)